VPMFSRAHKAAGGRARRVFRPRCRCGPGGAAARGTARQPRPDRLLKARDGALDYVDLLLIARDLVRRRRRRGAPSSRRASHASSSTEFQDTDPLQAEILLLLAADDPTSATGPASGPSPASSSRRRSETVDLSLPPCGPCRCTRRSAAADTAGVRPAGADHELPKRAGSSGSSTPRSAAMHESATTAARPATCRDRPPAAHRAAAVGRGASGAAALGKKAHCRTEIERSLPDAVGAFVEWLLRDSGWFVTERESGKTGRVPIRPARLHPCSALRQLHHRCHARLRRCARGARREHLLVGGRAFHNREEIETVRARSGRSSGRTTKLSVFADAAGGVVCHRRRGVARVSPPLRPQLSAVQDPRSPARAPDADR